MILKGLITKIKLRNFLVSNLLPVAPSTINEGFPWPPTWKVFGLLALFAVFGCPIADLRTAHTLRRDWRFHTGYGLL